MYVELLFSYSDLHNAGLTQPPPFLISGGPLNLSITK